MTDLLNHSIYDIAMKIKARDVSPVDLTETALERIGATEGALNAYVRIDTEAAMRSAREAEAEISTGNYRGELHGVPVAIKDIFDIQGLPTLCGSKARYDHMADLDSACVSRLKQAGAVIVGKTQTHEFTFGIVTPTTGNPWNPEHIPGGSSGGSAASVAARGCFMAMGSDTGGSIRIPAAACGIVGLKPTFGRISRCGVASNSWSLDHVGPLTRTVRDAAICLKWLAGYDPADPGSADEPVDDYLSGLDDGVNGLRIGVPQNYFFDLVHGDVESAVRKAIEQFQSFGATINTVEIPMTEQIMPVEFALCMSEASAYHRNLLRERADLLTEDVRPYFEAGEFIPATDYINALRVRQQIKDAWQEMYRDIDVVIAPTVALPASHRGQDMIDWGSNNMEAVTPAFVRLTAPSNITGLPSIAVPCGISGNRLPVSFQIIGRPFAEATILKVAQTYQNTTDWHTKAPLI